MHHRVGYRKIVVWDKEEEGGGGKGIKRIFSSKFRSSERKVTYSMSIDFSKFHVWFFLSLWRLSFPFVSLKFVFPEVVSLKFVFPYFFSKFVF